MMGWMAPSLIAIVRDEDDARLPDLARQLLQVLAVQIEQLEAAVAAIEKQLMPGTRATPSASAWRAFRASALTLPQPSPPRW